jgi:preprotein translocase subunit SecE
VNDLTSILIWVAVIGGAFAFLWYKGYLKSLQAYIEQTREELKKCTWPTWDELKGSTAVVFISIAILGLFTIVVDGVSTWLVRHLT